MGNDVKPTENHPHMSLEMGTGNALSITYEGATGGLEAATGNRAVFDGLLAQLANLGSRGKKLDERASNFALGYIDAMAPRDPAEALLCAQMAAIHQATMMMARRLNLAETLPQQDAAERALNKLARTYAAQIEAMKRYRGTGQQKVVVEHVTVNAGGQAIVGSVTRGEGEAEK